MGARVTVYPGIAAALAKAAADPRCVEIAAQAAGIAQATAPRDTGAFAGSIGSSGRTYFANDEAAGYIELGTSDTPAHLTLINAGRGFGRYVGIG